MTVRPASPQLTDAQHKALDRTATAQPDAKVVMWSDYHGGPVLSYATGRYYVATPDGRLESLSANARKALL